MSYLGNSPQTVTTVDYQFIATAGQTVFTGNDSDGKILAFELGNVDVFVNGFLMSSDDYVETTGTITLNDPRDASDVVLIRAKGTYSNTDHYTKAESPALAANNTFSGNNTFVNVNLDSINGGSLSGFRNRLQNPLFQVDIEGNAAGVTVHSKHVVEGWLTYFSNSVTTQTTSRVAGNSVPYALRYVVTTGSDASIIVGEYAYLATSIEGYDVSDALWGTANAKSVWISGRIKAPTTGTYCIGVRNSATTRSYVFEVSCTAGTWVNFEKEIPGDTSGTWGSTNGVGLHIGFTIAAGSTYQTTADTWSTGSFLATANQANGLATNGNIYEIEDIRVSVGGPIPTEWRPYALDLAHCQRYYEVGSTDIAWNGYAASGTAYYSPHIPFKVTKRTTSTFTKSDSVSSFGALAVGASTVYGFRLSGTATATTNSAYFGASPWTASARLI